MPLKISVVIPLYNKAPYIKRAIDSVLKQTVPAQEIIVVDDGSSDGGGDIIQGLNIPKITLIKQENLGQGAARNRGIKSAKYELIAFLDADDEWLPDFLENIHRLLNNFPDCGAYATASSTIRQGGIIVHSDISLLPPAPWIGIIPNFFALFQHGLAFNSSSVVIPKRIFDEIGGFRVDTRQSEDFDLWARIAIEYPIAFCPKRKVIYHQDAQNRTAPTNPTVIEDPALITIQKAIENGKFAEGVLLDEALEYIAQKQLSVAMNNIIAGNRVKGIEFLKRCQYTRKYKKDWRFWRILSLLPAFLPKTLMKIKNTFLQRTEMK